MKVIATATYYCKNYHKNNEGKYRSIWEKGVTRLLYVPLDVVTFLGLNDGDVIEFAANENGRVIIRKVRKS